MIRAERHLWKRHSPFLIVFLLIQCCLAGTVTGQPSAQDVMSEVRNRLSRVETLAANFTQTFSSTYLDETETTSGDVILQGTKYRVETPSQIFVTDGSVTWIYDATENQVLVNDYVEDETTFSLSRFLFDVEERYRVLGLETAARSALAEHVVSLKALDPVAFFPRATLHVRESDYVVTKIVAVDANETIITIELSNIVFDPPVKQNVFRFDPPDTAEIVDLRS